MCIICGDADEDDDDDDDLVCMCDLYKGSLWLKGSPDKGFPGQKQEGVSSFAASNPKQSEDFSFITRLCFLF